MRGNSSPSPARLHLLDVARFLAFYAIVVFHWTYALWAPSGWTEIPMGGPWIWPLEFYARFFAFSGFAVLFISFFLIGWRKDPAEKLGRLLKVLPVFALIWLATAGAYSDSWDIYPFLIVAAAVAGAAVFFRFHPLKLLILSVVGLSIPFWRFESFLPMNHFLRSVMTGSCMTGEVAAEWPLFPWVFYPLFALALGEWTFTRREQMKQISRRELALWCAGGALAFPFLGAYIHTPLGDAFGCYAFRRPFAEFWSAQWAILLVVRLALLKNVDLWLSRSTAVQWVSASPVSTRFLFVYCAHYPVLLLMAHVARRLGLNYEPWILTAGFVMIGFMVECFRGAQWRKVRGKVSVSSSTT